MQEMQNHILDTKTLNRQFWEKASRLTIFKYSTHQYIGMLQQARVSYKKPDLLNYRFKNFSTYDLHIHSRFSDGRRTVEQILDTAKRKGIGVSITDHNEAKGSLRAVRLGKSLNPRFNVPVIPGIECTSSEGIHLLFYFCSPRDLEDFYIRHIEKFKSQKNPTTFLSKDAEAIIDDSRGYGCIISAAHPYAILWTGLMKHTHNRLDKRILSKIDGIEVINGSITKRMNRKAIDFALKSDMAFTGGSDAHMNYEIGDVVTYVRQKCTPEEFLDHVLKKDNFVVGKQAGIMRKTASHASKFKSNDYPSPIAYIKRGIRFVRQQRKSRKQQRIKMH